MLPRGDRIALLVLALASAEPKLHLCQAVREVHPQWDEREPLLRALADQPFDLAAVKQEFPRAERIVGSLLALLVGGDVHVLEPDLPLAHAGERLGERPLALPQRLDLRAGERDARLEALEDLVVAARPAVGGDRLLARIGGSRTHDPTPLHVEE